MHTSILCIAGLAGGAALGLRFKVFALVPITALVALLVIGVEFQFGASWQRIVLSVALSTAALQVGYVLAVLPCCRRAPRPLLIVAAVLASLFPLGAFGFSSMTTGEPMLAPLGLVEFCMQKPYRCELNRPEIVQITPERWNQLTFVNTLVNRSIEAKPDLSIIRPWRDDAAQGDCKDYALTKRSRLIDLGWPSSALLIATAEVASGEGHAVLIAVTDKGDFVLDNLRYGIVSYRVLQYRWIERMSPDNPQFWHRIISWLRGHPGAILIMRCFRP
jgi:predicted transglutaminase-like cysteine proteinase